MDFLPKTLDSVLSQTFQDYEVIIVNDGSSDNIVQWSTQLTDPRLKLISQENQGLSAARNVGIAHAQGKYIAFLDADDIWDSSKLEKQVRVLEDYPEVGLVYSWVGLVDDKSKPLGKLWQNTDEGDVWIKLTKGNIIACGSVPMIRHRCIQIVGLFEKIPVCEDWDFWLRIAAHYHFKVIKEVLVYYRATPASLSRSESTCLAKKLQEIDQSYDAVIEKAFDDAPQHLQYLKSHSHALAKLRIAWTALQDPNEGYNYAQHFRRQAVFYDPQLILSQEYKRLNNALLMIRLLGSWSYTGYRKLKKFTRIFKHYHYFSDFS